MLTAGCVAETNPSLVSVVIDSCLIHCSWPESLGSIMLNELQGNLGKQSPFTLHCVALRKCAGD